MLPIAASSFSSQEADFVWSCFDRLTKNQTAVYGSVGIPAALQGFGNPQMKKNGCIMCTATNVGHVEDNTLLCVCVWLPMRY